MAQAVVEAVAAANEPTALPLHAMNKAKPRVTAVVQMASTAALKQPNHPNAAANLNGAVAGLG